MVGRIDGYVDGRPVTCIGDVDRLIITAPFRSLLALRRSRRRGRPLLDVIGARLRGGVFVKLPGVPLLRLSRAA